MLLKELLKYVGIDLDGSGVSGSIVPIEGADVSVILYKLSLMVFIFFCNIFT